MTTAVQLAQSVAPGVSLGFKNRIINGQMQIDQRNAGASVANNSTTVYSVDRWCLPSSVSSKFTAQQNAGSVTPPSGFINYLGITSSSSYSVGSSDYFALVQRIEGLNTADLGWGAAGASTVTLSFWVRSSLTGTFGGALVNDGFNYSYPFSYTISSAGTWEQKTITIAGPTSGTWLKTNGTGISIQFGLGVGSTYSGAAGSWAASGLISATGATSVVGTNGATFYITGVQLEKGSTATSFDYRPYGTELQLCQRYYYKTDGGGAGARMTQAGYAVTTTVARVSNVFPVPMRVAPTALEQSGTAGQYSITGFGTVRTTCSAVPTFQDAITNHALTNFTVASGLTAWTAGQGAAENTTTPSATTAYLAWSAEL